MPLKPLLPAIVMAFAASILVMVLAAIRDARFLCALAALLFALQMIFAMLRINVPLWRARETQLEDGAVVLFAWRNALLTAVVYAWGAAAMLAVYSLSPLSWRHWWQYGAAMAIVATGIFLYAYRLSRADEPLRTPRALDITTGLAALQGLAACGGLVFLVVSGKLGTPKADWAANQIFLAGSAMLAIMSILSVLTRRKLARHRSRH